MSKITYANKSALNVNSSIADANKCNASDMNEIKNVVNQNDNNVGALSGLNTTNKSSIVNAVNEVNTNEINNTYYKTGDSITLPYFIVGGFITGGTTNVLISIIPPKNLANITSISVTSYNAELRGISGYLNNQSGYVQYVGLSDYTITATKENNNVITITLLKSSAFTNVTNNTPITARVSLTLNLS